MFHNEDIKRYLLEISQGTYNSLIREVNAEREANAQKEIFKRFDKIRDEIKELLEDFPTLEFYNHIECEDCDYETRIELEDFLDNMEWCL